MSGIEYMMRPGRWKYLIRFPREATDFSVLQISLTIPATHPVSSQIVADTTAIGVAARCYMTHPSPPSPRISGSMPIIIHGVNLDFTFNVFLIFIHESVSLVCTSYPSFLFSNFLLFALRFLFPFSAKCFLFIFFSPFRPST
jgi:hypothetical protein